MKNLLFCFTITILSLNVYSQSTSTLDEKNGFMDLKIGNSITTYNDNVFQDEKDSSVYKIKNLTKYNLDNREINKIELIVSKDSYKQIEQIVFYFTDRAEELVDIAKDKSINFNKRKESLELAEKINSQGTDLSYYYDLFYKAFGEPKTENQTSIWKGKKVQLIFIKIKGNGYGIITFSKIYSSEAIKKSKQQQAKTATSKF